MMMPINGAGEELAVIVIEKMLSLSRHRECGRSAGVYEIALVLCIFSSVNL